MINETGWLTLYMTKPKMISLVVLAVAAVSCWQPGRQTSQARIKVENNGGIIAGRNTMASNQFGYDPYFIHENHTPEISIQTADKGVSAK